VGWLRCNKGFADLGAVLLNSELSGCRYSTERRAGGSARDRPADFGIGRHHGRRDRQGLCDAGTDYLSLVEAIVNTQTQGVEGIIDAIGGGYYFYWQANRLTGKTIAPKV